MDEIFLGVMDLQEAKNHQYKLKSQNIEIELKTNSKTCMTGCKITVEVWGSEKDKEHLSSYFQQDFMKHVAGHKPNLEFLSQIFDPSSPQVICQACGAKFAPTITECPECGLYY